MKHSETRPQSGLYDRLGREHDRVLEEAAAVATDRQTRRARAGMQRIMRGANLKRLANAVGWTSSLQKGKRRGKEAWGAVFAKGGDESLAGGALYIYSRGGVIKPIRGQWLWIATPALGRRMGVGGGPARFRITPARYRAAGSPLGVMKFRRITPLLAQYYATNLLVNPKGRARRPGPRARSTPQKRVVLFWGIRMTRRSKRFDPQKIVAFYGGKVPDEIVVELRRYLASQ